MNERAELLNTFGMVIRENAEALTEVIDGAGELTTVDSMKSSIRFLIAHGLVLGDAEQGYAATPLIFDLYSTLMRESTYRRVAPDVVHWKDEIRHDIEQLLLADRERDDKVYARRFMNLRQALNSFAFSLQAELSDIDAFVQGSFGFTDSLASRRIESERLLSRVKTFLDKLTVLSVHTLYSMAKGNVELEFLLVSQFSPTIDNCLSRFKVSQDALDHTLFRIRQRYRKTQLVLSTKKHLKETTDFLSEDLSEELLLDSKFNVVQQNEMLSGVSLDHIRLESPKLIELVKSLKPAKEQFVVSELPKEVVLDESVMNEVIAAADPMKPKIDGFMRAIRLAGADKKSVSAVVYWLEDPLDDYALDHWLLYVYHQQFLSDERLHVEYCGKLENNESCNNYISDIKVQLVNAA